MESLKEDLLLSWKAVDVFQEGSEMWKYHDKRVRDLIELLYGDRTRPEVSQKGRTEIQEDKIRR